MFFSILLLYVSVRFIRDTFQLFLCVRVFQTLKSQCTVSIERNSSEAMNQ